MVSIDSLKYSLLKIFLLNNVSYTKSVYKILFNKYLNNVIILDNNIFYKRNILDNSSNALINCILRFDTNIKYMFKASKCSMFMKN